MKNLLRRNLESPHPAIGHNRGGVRRPRPAVPARRALLSGLISAFAVVATGFAALTPTEWQHRQSLTIAAPGLVKVAVPAATFDAAQPDLADLRVLDASGQEIAYLLDRDLAFREPVFEQAKTFRPKSFRVTPAEEATQLFIETGTDAKLDCLDLETTAPFFLKAAHVDVSTDGTEWQSLGPAVPVFRQFGAEQLRIALGRRAAAFVRVTLDDYHTRPIAFSGAKILPAPTRAAPPALAPLGVEITRRDEFAGETVLTVTLAGRHVPLAALTFNAKDPLFMRRVTVTIREVRGAVSSERIIGAGTIYRVALDGAPAQSELTLPLDFSPPTRELLVHIHNGDSPPLPLDGVQAQQHPVHLLFLAPAAGAFSLLSGNPQATALRYDLAAFAGEMRVAAAATVVPGALEDMPNHRARESLATPPLPDIPLTGAPLDTKDWSEIRAVQIGRAGVQELELDPAVLARARPDFADLRLMRAGNQIPYVLELPALARLLSLDPVAVPDKKRPTVSVWRVQLPQANLPLRRVTLTSATPLFSRQFRFYEKVPGEDGGTRENTLASGEWRRTPDPGVPETRAFELSDRVRTDTLWLETDNGDNPAVALGAVQVVYPVVRLVFKVANADGFALAYGNKDAGAPRYDLNLVAVKLLTSPRNVAHLAAAPLASSSPGAFAGLNSRVVFWVALALVVIVLLVAVAKLLPKPPAPPAA
jgi:hypothetical protein